MKFFKARKTKIFIAVLLIISMISGLGGNNAHHTYAADAVYATGVVTASSLNLRKSPGTGAVITGMPTNSVFYISNETVYGNDKWYYGTVSLPSGTYEGWASSLYLNVTMLDFDTDYANALRGLGFPESYIPYLVSMHQKYPSWVFQAVNTNLKWTDVINAESRLTYNVVPNSYDDSRKSTAAGAYNWYTNQWTIVDNTYWVNASSGYIAYHIDPRNFLNDTYVFMFESSAYSNAQTVEGVQAIIKGTWMEKATVTKTPITISTNGTTTDATGESSTISYAEAIYEAGKVSGVNPYHLATRLRQEQGGYSNPSNMMSGTYPGYEGYYNAFNFGTSGTGEWLYKNGLTYAKNRNWNSPYKAIMGGATLLYSGYISSGQDTLYFQKFNVASKTNTYGHQYMQNVEAPKSEGKNLGNGYADKNQAFVFRIPIFNEMPENPVTFTDTGNPNNYLKTLSVSGVSITPNFDGAKTSYSAVVDYSVSKVTVSATAVSAKSTITGTGSFDLKVGANTINVNCKAQNGTVKTYTISIQRKEQPATPTYSVSSSKYTIQSTIRGIQPGTSVKDFTGAFTATNCNLKVLKEDGSENTGNIGTGNKLVVYYGGTVVASYDLIIFGDVNGDGKISMADLVKVNKHILGSAPLSGIYASAGDVNHDGKGIKMADLVMVNKQILGVYTITQ